MSCVDISVVKHQFVGPLAFSITGSSVGLCIPDWQLHRLLIQNTCLFLLHNNLHWFQADLPKQVDLVTESHLPQSCLVPHKLCVIGMYTYWQQQQPK
jgi:hypothetical protein